jgi:hypothetical protein
MIAKCIANQAQDVPHHLGVLFFDLSVKFDLTIGVLYPVLGLELYQDILQILVPDDSDRRLPQWMPVDLFDIELSELPADWFFVSYPAEARARQRGFRARWGYRLLVESDEHRDGLEELDSAALAVFAVELKRAANR